MTVSFAAVVLAILHVAPHLPKTRAEAYATVIYSRAKASGRDPLLFVAIAQHESGFHEGAINKKSGALGLGQILPRYRPACAKFPGSAACSAEKKKLLDGVYNLGVIFDAADAWRTACGKKTGKAVTEAAWLAAYAGLNRPWQGGWCGYQATKAGWTLLPPHRLIKEFFGIRRRVRLWIDGL